MYTPFPRQVNKIIGASLMVFGFFLATPPGMITPDDFLNIFLAGIVMSVTGFSKITALVLTYTVIAWGLIIIGALIYPYNTRRLLNGKWNMFRKYMKKTFTDPRWFLLFLVSIAIIWWIFTVYSDFLVGGL